jgi:predicted nucleotidyltransferase
MESREEILSYLKRHRDELFTRYGLSRLGLFGSYARGDAGEESDVDIVFEFTSGTARDVYLLKKELRKTLVEAFGRPVDLAREKYLKPYVREAIIRDAIYV